MVYGIAGHIFKRMFILVDGIYPEYSRFVKGMKQPVTEPEKLFNGWQESARKDVERAFGNLQNKFQVVARPMYAHNLKQMGDTVATCLILHNMCVSDRLMQDPRARYDPAVNVNEELEAVAMPNDIETVQALTPVPAADLSVIGLGAANDIVQQIISMRDEWRVLKDKEEHARLRTALMELKVQQYNQYKDGQS